MEQSVWLMLAFTAPRLAVVISSRMAFGGTAGRWMELLWTLRWEPSRVEAEGEGCESLASVFQPRSYTGNRCCAGLTGGFYKSISPLFESVGKWLLFIASTWIAPFAVRCRTKPGREGSRSFQCQMVGHHNKPAPLEPDGVENSPSLAARAVPFDSSRYSRVTQTHPSAHGAEEAVTFPGSLESSGVTVCVLGELNYLWLFELFVL